MRSTHTWLCLLLTACETTTPTLSDVPDARAESDAMADSSSSSDAGADTDITGTWRLVAYETSASGVSLALTDRNSTVFLPGVGNIDGRTNGWMTISRSRASSASSMLFGDHVYPAPGATDYATAMQTTGIGAPGTVEGSTFRPSGSATGYVYTQNRDGTITHQDAAGGHATWQRASAPESLATILTIGQAVLFQPESNAPMATPRAALLWDQPNGSNLVSGSDSAIVFQGYYGRFSVSVALPPDSARVTIGSTAVAVGYWVVYDDINASETFDAEDILRGRSAIATTYRSTTESDSALANSRFADLLPGLSFAHLHMDASFPGELGLSPFDPTLPISPDILVDVSASRAPMPNLVP